ncbi:lysoplasmalogenase [Ideonella sp. YS5]|uniref:lysoplasmalogenase n=1 Tax=Ideonella sp. YS5 TaxID=3453714 RepID=UPI003EEBB787
MPPRALPMLLAAALAAAVLAIAAEPVGQPWLLFTFKPLATALLIAWAWPRGADHPARRAWIRAGLVLSWFGDVALLWPDSGFLPGLVAFLLAHLAYIAAFSHWQRFGVPWWPFAGYALLAAVILSRLWPGVPSALQLPVLAYVAALACMAAQAAAVAVARRGDADASLARRAMLGGALFLVSDATLAFSRFHAAVPMSALWILATYWLAQWAIAASLQSGANSPEDARKR